MGVISLYGRIVDLENFDVILNEIPNRFHQEIFMRIGYLNILNPLKCFYDFYELDLQYNDHWVLMKMMLDLSADTGDMLTERSDGVSSSSIPDLYAKKANLPRDVVMHFSFRCNMAIEETEKTKEARFKVSKPYLKQVLLGSIPRREALSKLPKPFEELLLEGQSKRAQDYFHQVRQHRQTLVDKVRKEKARIARLAKRKAEYDAEEGGQASGTALPSISANIK